MKRTHLIGAAAFTLLWACIGNTHHAAAKQRTMPIKEYMGHVISYAAKDLWSRQGWVTDQAGEHSLFPRNDQEWEDAESSALVLAELIGVLSHPDRRMDVPGWDGTVTLLRTLALDSAAAAEHHDAEAFMQLGVRIDEACEACHVAAGMK
jgi:hypothetical protein